MIFAPDVLRRYLDRYEANIRKWLRLIEDGPKPSAVIQRKPIGMPEAVCVAEAAGFCRARCVTERRGIDIRSDWEWTITDAGRVWLARNDEISRVGERYLTGE